jgi:putative MFS transporter
LDAVAVSGAHRRLITLVGAGLFGDGYASFLTVTMAGVLEHRMALSRTGLSAVLAAAFLGQVAGSLLFGRLADVMGRRRMFLLNIGIYTSSTLLGAFSPGPLMLIVTRVVAGIGIGAQQTLSGTYLCEVLPARARGRGIATAYALGCLAMPVQGFLAMALAGGHPLGLTGWRWLFLLGGSGMALVWAAMWRLPESPRWLAQRGRAAEASAVLATLGCPPIPVVAAPRPRTRGSLRGHRGLVLAFAAFVVLQVVGCYGFAGFVPEFLAHKGLSQTHSMGYAAASFLGYPLGSLLALPVIERVGRKPLVVLCAGVMAGIAAGFALVDNAREFVLLGVLYTMTSNVFASAIHVYLPESFPTAVRGTASGTIYALAKLTTAVLPFVVIPLLDGYGPVAVFAMIAVALVGVMGLVTAFGPTRAVSATE